MSMINGPCMMHFFVLWYMLEFSLAELMENN